MQICWTAYPTRGSLTLRFAACWFASWIVTQEHVCGASAKQYDAGFEQHRRAPIEIAVHVLVSNVGKYSGLDPSHMPSPCDAMQP